ncbi:MAG TPA: alpha/beta hydrolase [Candidatus Dormibacteraeota bacterium]|nr:alpha/beta hydrolase [Candidatus Dormibacteraeota bacterium]
MTASQHMVQANGLRFRTLVDGPPDGDLAVLLHGFPEGAESWSKQVAALARAGVLAVAPDMRGYGMTDAPPSVEDYVIDTLVADVAGIIKAFGRDRAHVAGHDWGAVVAWFFASMHPEMTRTLTVLSVGHPAAVLEARADAEQREASAYIRLFLMEGKAEEVLAEDDFKRLRTMFGDGLPRGAAEGFIRSLQRPGRLTAGLNYYRANFSSPAAWAARAATVSVTAPTVLMWGDQDPALRRLQAEKTAEHMTGEYHLEVLEGAGHWLQFERPDQVGSTLVAVTTK